MLTEVMAGPQEGHELVAGSRRVIAVEQEPIEAFLPGGTCFGLDDNLLSIWNSCGR